MTEELAQQWGVESGYHDVFGNWHKTHPDTLNQIVSRLSAGRAHPAHVPHPEHWQAFQGDGARRWGIAVQLYAVRSARNWGIGDFSDLREVLEVAAQSGADAVGLNPLHSLFLDNPGNASPYAPTSRLFLNPLYIDVTALPEYRADDIPQLSQTVERLQAEDLVDYPGVAALKEAALRRSYERFVKEGAPERRAAFDSFRNEQGEKLTRFACFEVLRRRFPNTSWRQWPDPWRHPDASALARLRTEEDHACGFFEFLQWAADEQLGRCRQRAQELGMSIGLYLDLAVGGDPDGADTWSHQSAVLTDFSIGAPPDEFNPAGQDWGLAPFNPHALPDNDFAIFRALLAAAMRHAGAVRLDHVLGLMRLFLVPHGATAAEGAYVRFPFEALLRVIAEESHRHHCIFIGEDLGTVPEGFRETAERWGVWSYRVMVFERWGDGEFKPAHEYPAQALATFNTHDLPTFRGWITGHDLRVKRELGIDPGENEESRGHGRAALQRALSRATGAQDLSFAAAAAYLAETPSRLVMVAVDDLLDVADQTNIPGTIDQHPNWRRKLPVPVERWREVETWKAVTEAFARSGRSIGR